VEEAFLQLLSYPIQGTSYKRCRAGEAAAQVRASSRDWGGLDEALDQFGEGTFLFVAAQRPGREVPAGLPVEFGVFLPENARCALQPFLY
jgi:hypothetical protein